MLETRKCCKCEKEKPLSEFRCRGRGIRPSRAKKCLDCYKLGKKQYNKKYRESSGKYHSDWVSKNIEKNRAYKKKYRDKNKDKALAYARERRANDINFKIRGNLRHRIWLAVKGFVKSANTEELLGCTVEHFLKYMESQFVANMSWENYGLSTKGQHWEIDHIIPCAAFDLSDAEQQHRCFHYTNMQPLWREDNLKKSDKVTSRGVDLCM